MQSSKVVQLHRTHSSYIMQSNLRLSDSIKHVVATNLLKTQPVQNACYIGEELARVSRSAF